MTTCCILFSENFITTATYSQLNEKCCCWGRGDSHHHVDVATPTVALRTESLKLLRFQTFVAPHHSAWLLSSSFATTFASCISQYVPLPLPVTIVLAFPPLVVVFFFPFFRYYPSCFFKAMILCSLNYVSYHLAVQHGLGIITMIVTWAGKHQPSMTTLPTFCQVA